MKETLVKFYFEGNEREEKSWKFKFYKRIREKNNS